MSVILFDDKRSFAPGYRDDAIIVRNVADARELFANTEVIDELWLDYELRPGETIQAFHALAKVKEIRKIIFHDYDDFIVPLIEYWLKRHGIATPLEISSDVEIFQRTR